MCLYICSFTLYFFFQAEDGIRDADVTGVQTCALPISFAVVNAIGAIKSQIYAENKQKISTSIKDFEKYVKVDDLIERLITFETEGITPRIDRKSTRLNSSHVRISYAVFCLKKKIKHSKHL